MTDAVDDPAGQLTGEASADEDHHQGGDLRWYQEPAAEHPAATVLLVSLLVAYPLLVFGVGSRRWFFNDEWDFLVTRSATNLGDLFRPHNENLSTIPVLVYRALFNVFHLNAYWPYVTVVVLAHLAVVGLLWLIMRRCGVNQWVALLPALALLTFGTGNEDIVWAFQMGYTGALALGLVQLLLADHDGPIGRRDALALAAGFGALLCSGIGVTTVFVVGVACLLRRGWRAAALQTVPLGLFYLVWVVAAKPDGPANPFHDSTSGVIRHVVDWDMAEARHTFLDLGHFAIVAAALALMLVVGLWLAWRPVGLGGVRRRYSTIVALVAGAVAFATLSGYGRWFFGSDYSAQPRYVYLAAALVLPAVGVAADALIRRWRPLIPVIVALLVIGVPANIEAFNHMFPNATYPTAAQQYLVAVGESPLAGQVDPNTVLRPAGYPGLTVGWVARAVRQGWLPPTTVPPAVAAQTPLELGVAQAKEARPAGGHCQTVITTMDLKLSKGSVFWVDPQSLHHFAFVPSFFVTLLDDHGRPITMPKPFSPAYGNHFTVAVPKLTMRLRAQPAPGLLASLPFVVCHN